MRVFYNGMDPAWRPTAEGCLECNFTDSVRRNSGSEMSIYAKMAAWGSLAFESDVPFASDR